MVIFGGCFFAAFARTNGHSSAKPPCSPFDAGALYLFGLASPKGPVFEQTDVTLGYSAFLRRKKGNAMAPDDEQQARFGQMIGVFSENRPIL